MKKLSIFLGNKVSRWLYSSNHKDMGTLYLIFGMWPGLVLTGLSFLMHYKLAYPENMANNPDLYKSMITAHGLIMMFFFVMPVLMGGFGNWLIHLYLKSPDMAFPRLNKMSFWLLPPALLLFQISFMFKSKTSMMVFSLHLAGVSSILSFMKLKATMINAKSEVPLCFTLSFFRAVMLAHLKLLLFLVLMMVMNYKKVVYAMDHNHLGTKNEQGPSFGHTAYVFCQLANTYVPVPMGDFPLDEMMNKDPEALNKMVFMNTEQAKATASSSGTGAPADLNKPTATEDITKSLKNLSIESQKVKEPSKQQ